MGLAGDWDFQRHAFPGGVFATQRSTMPPGGGACCSPHQGRRSFLSACDETDPKCRTRSSGSLPSLCARCTLQGWQGRVVRVPGIRRPGAGWRHREQTRGLAGAMPVCGGMAGRRCWRTRRAKGALGLLPGGCRPVPGKPRRGSASLRCDAEGRWPSCSYTTLD